MYRVEISLRAILSWTQWCYLYLQCMEVDLSWLKTVKCISNKNISIRVHLYLCIAFWIQMYGDLWTNDLHQTRWGAMFHRLRSLQKPEPVCQCFVEVLMEGCSREISQFVCILTRSWYSDRSLQCDIFIWLQDIHLWMKRFWFVGICILVHY